MKHEIHFLPLLFLILSMEITMIAAQPNHAESDPGIGNEYPRTKFSRSMAMIIAITGGALLFVGLISVSIRYCYKQSRSATTKGGLHPSVTESLPTFSYSQVKDHKIGKDNLECSVCLNEFEDQQTLRLIPLCNHVFHPECIVAWLESHVTCPVCRANLGPQADHVPESSHVRRTSLNSRFEY